jgi:cephalosporin-C deacetylase
MAFFDMPLEQLRAYRPVIAQPDDFDEFWGTQLHDARTAGQAPRVASLTTRLHRVAVHDVTFSGYAGDPIKAWYLHPRDQDGLRPTVVEFIGYGGGRGLPHERLAWVTAGYGYVVMDTRGQGWNPAAPGDTPDPHGSPPAALGMLTRGIDDPATAYYTRLFIDAARCVDAVREFPEVDPDRVIVTGASQGGGVALAAAGMQPAVNAALVDVPFLCHFERAIGLTDRDPYAEVMRYLAAQRDRAAAVFRTLSYLDGANFAARAAAPALFSVGLQDATCPPSTVFAAFNAYGNDRPLCKDITVYPFNDHEGGSQGRWATQIEWLETAVLRTPASDAGREEENQPA